MLAVFGLFLLLPLTARPGAAVDLSRAEDRLGVLAPPLKLSGWLNSPALEMDGLRGRVVLIW
jgi:hypothetical protein